MRHSAGIGDIESVYTLLSAVEKWNSRDRSATVRSIMTKIEAYRRYGMRLARTSVRAGEDRIHILTAHTSKGLEYEAVFVPYLAEKVWNDRRSPADIVKLPDTILGIERDTFDSSEKEDEKLRKEEEDRRLFFVAVTRAKRTLVLSYPLASDDTRSARVESRYFGEVSLQAERAPTPEGIE
ncbi:MAG TPA: 3'-5' exonuclease [bacterium]|nr:3'-5' exonuclease [bacterium]